MVAEVENQFIERTKKLWQLHADHPLTDEDAKRIIENAVGFFEILWEWEKRERDQKLS